MQMHPDSRFHTLLHPLVRQTISILNINMVTFPLHLNHRTVFEKPREHLTIQRCTSHN